MSGFTVIKISKLNVITLVIASDIIIIIYIRELTGCFYLKRDSVLKYLIRLHTI